eukprot:scaffold34930_cov191-Amphora_coffeaeformis.AAC.2
MKNQIENQNESIERWKYVFWFLLLWMATVAERFVRLLRYICIISDYKDPYLIAIYSLLWLEMRGRACIPQFLPSDVNWPGCMLEKN